MLGPRHIFEDNIRPADLLLKVYRLLEHDVTCFRFFGQCDSLFWTAHGEPTDVKGTVSKSL